MKNIIFTCRDAEDRYLCDSGTMYVESGAIK